MPKIILEKDIEKYLVSRCKYLGFLCEKFKSSNKKFVPDRIITSPLGIFFVELKAPGKKPTAGQIRDHEKRRALGAEVLVLTTFSEIDIFFETFFATFLL